MSKRSDESATTPVTTPESLLMQGEKTAEQPRSQAPYAVASDGMMFINVSTVGSREIDLDAVLLAGRPLFIGAGLTGKEESLARTILEDASHEMRARIVGAMLKKRPGKEKPEGREP